MMADAASLYNAADAGDVASVQALLRRGAPMDVLGE